VAAVDGLDVELGLVRLVLEVDRVGNDAVVAELPDLLRAVLLPVHDVGILDDAHRAAGEDDGADGVVEAAVDDGLLVARRRAGLLGAHEARADPDGLRAERERHGEAAAVENAAGGNDGNGRVGERGAAAAAEVDDDRNEDRGGDVAGVAAALAALRANDVGAGGERLLDVLGRADHVHVGDAGGVQLVDRPARRHADGRDEELGARLNDNVNQLGQFAFGVVAVGLARTAANLRQQQIDAKRRILVHQMLLCGRAHRVSQTV
jgi:hypothetical protein